MIRRVILGACVVALCASLASAAPKVGTVSELLPNDLENDDADGAAFLIWTPSPDNSYIGTARALVVIWGFRPETQYYVKIGGAWDLGGPVFTNTEGNGIFWGSNPGGSLNPELHPIYPELGTVEVFLNEGWDGQTPPIPVWEEGERGAYGIIEEPDF